MAEMLELNSQLFALEHSGDPKALLQLGVRISEWMESLAGEVGPELSALEAGTAGPEQKWLLKECYAKLKYLLRIQQRISTFATRDEV